MAASQIRKGSQAADVDYEVAEEDEYYVTRPHTSVRRYRQPVQRDTMDDFAPGQTAFIQRRRASGGTPGGSGIASKAIDPSPVTSLPRVRRKHAPWLALALGMLLALGLVVGFSAFGSWWQLHQEDATYGMPRTYQTDAAVGHQDSASKPSHFIFMNMNGHVIVVEFPGADATHSIVYTGPTLFGSGGNLIPVTGEFRDVNGDGLPDMLVHVQDQTIVFINTGSKFRPLQPGEHVSL
ncbi:MAG TPA: hypothetical protein VGM01_02440 [Ktedonobacteraceae bacterium]|jgi:hypothetical protein